MAEALLLTMIQKLENEEFDLLIDYEDSEEAMEKVIDELRMILDFVRDKKLGEGSRINNFISDLFEIVGNLQSCIFDNDIMILQSWIGKIKTCMLQFGVDGAETESPIRSENVGVEGDDEDEDEDVVGLEEDVEMLLHTQIFTEEKLLQVLSIEGMVGIGKTTLARQLYNHVEVIDQFDRRAWVSIPTDFSHKEILMELIQKVVNSEVIERDSLKEKMERADNASLQQMLQQHLQGVRYFIVLDNLPKEILLYPIFKGLPDGDEKSRLLHTRCFGLPLPFYAHSIHEMKPLDSDKSWQLFLKTIFSGNKFTSEQKFPKQLERRGREILKMCSGLPLAIKEVGMKLAEKRRSGSEWEQVLESVDFGSTLELFEPFYDELYPQAKSGFLDLACFKVNTSIRIDKLMQIRAVGGMASLEENEDISVLDLLGESVIKVEDERPYSRAKSCRVNPLLHRLSIRKAKDEIGFEILTNNENNQPSMSPRHRVIISSRDKFNSSMNHGNKHLASLFFHGGGYFDSSPSYWNSFDLLQILDLEDFGLKSLPESIGTLIELRYLGLRNNYIPELPHSLGCLKKLEVLDIALNFMMEVPDIIWEMGSLRCLYLSDVICRKPMKIDALQNLEILTYVSVDNWTHELSGLPLMTKLWKLGIEELDGNLDVSKLFASLAKLENLDDLIVRWSRLRSMPCLDELGILRNLIKLKLDGVLASLPSADSFPPNIQYLTLFNTHLDEDPMPVLEKLPNLIFLKLRNAYTGRQMVIVQGGFPDLRFLGIEELWNMRNVQVGEGAMAKLEHLEIKNCPYLETLPEEIGSMTSLKELKMVTTKNTATKIRDSSLISKIEVVDINS